MHADALCMLLHVHIHVLMPDEIWRVIYGRERLCHDESCHREGICKYRLPRLLHTSVDMLANNPTPSVPLSCPGAGGDRGRGRAVDDSRQGHHPQRDAQGNPGRPVGLPALAQPARQGQDGQAQVRGKNYMPEGHGHASLFKLCTCLQQTGPSMEKIIQVFLMTLWADVALDDLAYSTNTWWYPS